MTKKLSAGEVVVAVVSVHVVCVETAALLAVVFFDVVFDFGFDVLFFAVVFGALFFGADFDAAADAEPTTNTASSAPSENATSVNTIAAAALRRGAGLVTTYLPCRSPAPPGSRSLPAAGRAGLRSRCGLPPPHGSRSSPEGRRRAAAGRRCRRGEGLRRRSCRLRRPRPRRGSCP